MFRIICRTVHDFRCVENRFHHHLLSGCDIQKILSSNEIIVINVKPNGEFSYCSRYCENCFNDSDDFCELKEWKTTDAQSFLRGEKLRMILDV